MEGEEHGQGGNIWENYKFDPRNETEQNSSIIHNGRGTEIFNYPCISEQKCLVLMFQLSATCTLYMQNFCIMKYTYIQM